MGIRHPPVEQRVGQPLRRIEGKTAEPRHRLAAIKRYMRRPEDRVVEPKAWRGEFEGVFRNRLAWRKGDHPLGARLLASSVAAILSESVSGAWSVSARARMAMNSPFPGRYSSRSPDSDTMATVPATSTRSCLLRSRMYDARIDRLKAVGAAVIVVIDDQRAADLTARIDAELENTGLLSRCDSRAGRRSGIIFRRREKPRCWSRLASTSRSGRRNPATP